MSVNEGPHLDCESECECCTAWLFDGDLVRTTEGLICATCLAERTKSYDERRDWYTSGQYSADCAPDRMNDSIAEYAPRPIEPEGAEPAECEP